ncbi:MAG TPA: hypothetical protein VGL89_01800 [Candidatus Koribacter sp.]|jgi:methylmalonyl-CoA carboxyltransferase large subunit
MRNAQIEIADIAGHLETLRQELEQQIEHLRADQAELVREVRVLKESAVQTSSKPAAVEAKPPQAVKPVVEEPIPEEVLLILSAAVAAFLGHSARIRAAHYVHDEASPWAQQGRVFVQASHNLVHHG